MNKSTLRNFAVWARRDLIKRISDRANLLGVYEDKPTKSIQAETEKGFVVNGVTFNYKKEIREAFIKKVGELGYQDAIEEIAYTWFNRIVALRFMEVNGYLVNGKNGEKIYVIGSTIAGKNEPDALTNADKLSFVDKFTVYDYQDANDNNGLYRYILTKQCNDLNNAMPLMFEKIEDYAELLLPDHLLDKGAIIDHLVNDISAKDFNITVKDDDGENASQVEIVGWLYQFYISEKKDEVFASKDQINKGTLPAVTQLFTPDWVVKYMTENSLGKMWVDGHKSSNLKQSMKYFVEEAEQTPEVQAKLDEINKRYAEKKVTDITFIDPCCGSGHILVYAFDLLYKMYLESGYIGSDIPSLILKNNLIGIDVDKRAVQLTSFALTMKALQYDKNFLSKGVYPNVIDMKESNSLSQSEINDFFEVTNIANEDREVVEEVIFKFKDAKLYGSLIKDLKYSPERYDVVLKWLENNVDAESKFNFLERLAIDSVKPLLCDLLKEAYILSSKYDIMATNPPYLSSSTNDKLKDFANTFYPDSKTDMFAMFMEVPLVKDNGFLAMINMHSWMFLQSYEKLRKKLLEIKNIISMLHLGARAFEEIGGEVVQTTTFVLRCNKISSYKAKWFRLVNSNSQNEKEMLFKQQNVSNKGYIYGTENFSLIPGSPIAYWISNKIFDIFNSEKILKEFGQPKQGLATTDNNRFVRNWEEVDVSKIGFGLNKEKAKISNFKWFPLNKGGEYRKWYGNNDCIVNYQNDGQEIKRNVLKKYPYLKTPDFVVKNADYYFKENGTWSAITSGDISVRYSKEGYIISNAGMAIYNDKNQLKYIIGFMNSVVAKSFIKVVNQTLNFNAGDIEKIPLIISNQENLSIITEQNIKVSKTDWDQYETSWDFVRSPLLQETTANCLLKNQYEEYKKQVNERFDVLKKNEEELNKIFIEIYGLQDELTPDVADKDITVARIYDFKDEIPEEMKNNIYVKTKQDVIKDFISYIVGCSFGRYSPNVNGLCFAGGEFNYLYTKLGDYSYHNKLLGDRYCKELSYKDCTNDTFNKENSTVSTLCKNGYGNTLEYTREKGCSFAGKSDCSICRDFYGSSNDNCIMITDNDYGTNNMIDYVVMFVKYVFGSENLEENLKFIANALDEKSTDTPRNVIRKYIANDFFKDHCKKYQNRPIYWQFDSGKSGGFKALMYLHRYDENAIPTARLSYLHDIQWKYEQEKDRLEKLIENTSLASEKAKAKKEIDLINKQIIECKSYDEILNHAANMRITLDLDDGVKVNYQKLQKLDGDKDKNILSTYLKF